LKANQTLNLTQLALDWQAGHKRECRVVHGSLAAFSSFLDERQRATPQKRDSSDSSGTFLAEGDGYEEGSAVDMLLAARTLWVIQTRQGSTGESSTEKQRTKEEVLAMALPDMHSSPTQKQTLNGFNNAQTSQSSHTKPEATATSSRKAVDATVKVSTTLALATFMTTSMAATALLPPGTTTSEVV